MQKLRDRAATGTRRSYAQACAIARALDVVGERWTLLLVRELLFGPRRFGELLEALFGIGPNLLSTRLKALSEEGLIRRVALRGDPRGGPTGYELTDAGRALEPVLLGLARWEVEREHGGKPAHDGAGQGEAGDEAGADGAARSSAGTSWATRASRGAKARSPRGQSEWDEPTAEEAVRPDWAILALRARFSSDASRGISEVYQVECDGAAFRLAVKNGQLETTAGRDPAAALTLHAGAWALARLALGSVGLEQAMNAGRVEVQGSPFAAARFARVFAMEGGSRQ